MDAILSGQLAPGSPHTVVSLAAKLHVSRTPVREALLQLERQGLVSFESGRGVRIRETTAHEVEEIFDLRLYLEPEATRLAVPRLKRSPDLIAQLHLHYDGMQTEHEPSFWSNDRAFHRVILDASGNRRLAQYVDSLRDLTLLRGAVSAELKADGFVTTAGEHLTILQAVELGRAAAAAAAMREHIKKTKQRVMDFERRLAAQS